MAAARGTTRAALDRAVRAGSVRRVLRGVYVDAAAADAPALRAAALGLVVPAGRVVTGAAAAWVHGVGPAPTRVRTVPDPGRGLAALGGRDVQQRGPVRVTTPLRTALDLGRMAPPDDAIAALDGFLWSGLVPHPALLAEVCRFSGTSGVAQLRRLAAVADGRAASAEESVLRLRWVDAELPTPTPRLSLAPGLVLALATPERRFGAVFDDALDEAQLLALRRHGWCVVVLSRDQVRSTEPALLRHHLEREFRTHLLAQVG